MRKRQSSPARLKVLLTAGLELADAELAAGKAQHHLHPMVKRWREGQTIFYPVADGHVLNLVDNAIEHTIEVSATNPDRCTPAFDHTGHSADHVHGPSCGHPATPHGDHVDYLVDGRLHHPHGNHCDDHGPGKGRVTRNASR